MVSAREGLTAPAAKLRRVAIRVDSSAEMGSGHLRRCLSLAGRLRARGAHVDFVCKAHPGNFNREVAAAGFGLLESRFELDGPMVHDQSPYAAWLAAAPDDDARTTAELLAPGAPVETLIVDHYGIDSRWENRMRAVANRIVVIDDLADREHDCDVLIDSAPGVDKFQRYARLAAGARLLIGPRFALLRPEFAEAAAAREELAGGIRNVVVTFGAVDLHGFSKRAVSALRRVLGSQCAIHVIMGSTSPQLGSLTELTASDPALQLHVSPTNVAGIMVGADLAVISAGVTAWECAALGVPAIATAIVDNQRVVADALASIPCALIATVGQFDDDIARCAAALATQPVLRRLFARAGRATVDGKGAARVARNVLPDTIVLRPAGVEDSRSIWAWRNDERVRRTSRSTIPIEWPDHESWFTRVIADPDRALLLARSGDEDVAVLRFDMRGFEAEISIYLTPASYGRGLGTQVLNAAEQWLRANRPAVETITAFVRAENESSRSAFTQAGYQTTGFHYSRQLKATHGQ